MSPARILPDPDQPRPTPPALPDWDDPQYACRTDPEFCGSCGRRLVLTVEPGLYDKRTGQRRQERWHSCPRYLVSSWKVAFIPGYGFGHDSHSADNPMLGRVWR